MDDDREGDRRQIESKRFAEERDVGGAKKGE